MPDDSLSSLYTCDYCGKGIWKGDPFFKCKEEECQDRDEEEEGDLIYCKDCVKRCEKCDKFFCKGHFQEHRGSCGEEE